MAADVSVGEIDREAVTARLSHVRDPELDRSIVDLGYIDRIDLDGTRVAVRLRLPTAWCSPAFAWMMATDARDAIEAVPGVGEARIELCDHMHTAEINRGVNEGLAFQEAFDDADDDVEDVRRRLEQKARLARQYRAWSSLLAAGLDHDQIGTLSREAMTIPDDGDRVMITLDDGGVVIAADAEPIRSYIEKARETGVLDDASTRLFATPDGDPVPPADAEAVYRESRLAKNNLDGQAAICEGLHASRNPDLADADADRESVSAE